MSTPRPITRPERADAARNRRRILEAAQRLVAERGIDNVSVDEVAAAAGVGKGTVYRRFGDRAGLAFALLDESERQLQESLIRGPAPLGPGAAPLERLRAFVRAYVELLERHVELVAHAETAAPGARYRAGVYAFWHRHVALLVQDAADGVDAEVVAHAVLAPLAGDLYRHQRAVGISAARIEAVATEVATRLAER
jgi:AcrR family transcriptional regulator